MMVKQFKIKRKRLQRYTSAALPIVLAGGWIFPLFGFFLLLCMFGAVGIAFYRGRAWCDWMCPRGSFYDLFVGSFSKKTSIPAVFRTNHVRGIVLSLLLGVLGIQIYYAWGDLYAIGHAFVRVLTVTTTAGIVLGAVYKPRAWCQICPMGTLGNWISRGKKQPLHVTEHCRDCKLCEKVCPMQLKPYESKSGYMTDGDCIKCSSCVATCPARALGFKQEPEKAA
jgi:ferredoxin-type protein NapH